MSDVLRFRIFELYVRLYGGSRSDPRQDPYHDRPRDRPWWPMRYFMDDWILGAWVYRVREREERCEVGLFLAEDHCKYQKDSGLKGSLIFLLTQTYHLLGAMEVHFVGPRPNPGEPMDRERLVGRQIERLARVEADGFGPTSNEARVRVEPILNNGFEPDIPPSIRHFAKKLGVKFANDRYITDAEGRLLYARLTGFSEATITEFGRRGIDLTRACFMVQRDIWAFEHVEYLLRNAYAPERVFGGGARPIERLSFQYDLLVLRVAVMEERLRAVFESFSSAERSTVTAEWISPTRVRYVSNADLSIPTLGTQPLAVRAGAMFEATLAPRSAQGYSAFQREDLARRRRSQPHLLAVTKDFEWSGITPKARAHAQVVPLFDTLFDLDLEIERRLSQAVTTRGELSERHD